MPYTNPWVDNIPSGSAQASTIDDQLRQLRLDIHERMDTILDTGKKWGDDPIGLPDITGTVVDRHVYINPFSIQPVNQSDNVRYEWGGHGIFKSQGSDLVTVCPVVLPLGVTITRVEFVSKVEINFTLTVKMYKRAWGITDTVTQIGSDMASAGTGSAALFDSGAASFSEVIDDSTYWLENIISAGVFSQYWLYGYRLHVNVPGAGSVV